MKLKYQNHLVRTITENHMLGKQSWVCEKCTYQASSYKQLREHKQEKHSY